MFMSEPNLNKFYLCFLNEGWVFVVCTLSQTSSVESMMFPKKGLTAALDTRISIPPHWSRVYFRHVIKTNNEVLRQIIHSQPYNYG